MYRAAHAKAQQLLPHAFGRRNHGVAAVLEGGDPGGQPALPQLTQETGGQGMPLTGACFGGGIGADIMQVLFITGVVGIDNRNMVFSPQAECQVPDKKRIVHMDEIHTQRGKNMRKRRVEQLRQAEATVLERPDRAETNGKNIIIRTAAFRR